MTARQLRRRASADIPPTLSTLHPLLARVFAARGVRGSDELDYSLRRLPDIWLLKDIRKAVERLHAALQRNESIVIIGDYDADGATSTALAIRGLRAMGCRRLNYLVPNRFDFGYGLSPEIVDLAAKSKPDLIITVDNGIANVAGVERASRHGIDVIITDHHLPGPELPAAAAIVNPNRPDDPFPGKSLAGVGVMLCLLIALRRLLLDAGWFTQRGIDVPKLATWLDLVALGTIADVVPLDHVNRVLVEQGLRRIRAGQGCPGIVALLTVAGRDPATMHSSDMGFRVGPRLNAAGRLEDMGTGIECLLADDPATAREYATQLDQLNQARREIEADMQQQALRICERLALDERRLPWGLALHHDDWHQGVVGLVASRLKERYHRPVIAFATAEDGASLKGSARSIPGLHMRDALERIDSRHPGLIEKFGGHAMAAGLSLPAAQFDAFRIAFEQTVREMLPREALEPVVISDGPIAPTDLTIETARLLQNCGPWGQGFPEPIFDGRFHIQQRRILKEKHLRYRLLPEHGEHTVEAIVFNVEPEAWPNENETIHIAYRLDINRYQGFESLQLMIEARIDGETVSSFPPSDGDQG